jgi:hypothetical protein
MPRNTGTSRRSAKPFGPEFARSLSIDELPRGGGARGSGGGRERVEPWRRPARMELRTYLVCGQLKPRMLPTAA